jgi:hypothetical protein
MATVLQAFDSTKPDLVDSQVHAASNPLEISHQCARFLDPAGVEMFDPEMAVAPFDGALEVQIDEADFGTKYDCLPEALCFDLYGTHDLWYMLMRINGATTRSEFVGPRLKFYRAVSSSGTLLDALKLAKRRVDATPVLAAEDLTIKRVEEL